MTTIRYTAFYCGETEIMSRQGKIDWRFKPTYDKLIEIRNALEKLMLTQAWSLRETDLYNFQRKLDRIDESRTEDGNFADELGTKAEIHTQRVSDMEKQNVMDY